MEDVEKDLLVIREDEVRASLWPAQMTREKVPEIATTQAAVQGNVCGHSWDEFRRLQTGDPDVGPVFKAVRNGTPPNESKTARDEPDPKEAMWAGGAATAAEGCPVRCLHDPRDGEEVRQLVVPASLQRHVYETQHDHGGHFSERGTLQLLRRGYCWPKMAADVKSWIQQCKRCALAKDVFPKSQAPMTCTNVTAPLGVLAMDFTVLEPLTGGCENVLVRFQKLVCALWLPCETSHGPRPKF